MKVPGSIFRGQNGAIGNLTINGMEIGPGSSAQMPVVESFPGAVFAPEAFDVGFST